ncbi:hypothetical protein MH215_10115 [Paenibacillus sp. ACRSA]|uniref:hypothetical protein n=1 Tax=Paenibacillus sp. ACRSA TaxID=2918211 RepID=UPI001EF64C38|nr:hypothetical protein [Paenibacillus sp. ACRSA]MCG7377350.1 hypothetical protein [Paenibacillus sp. ACRSA]
MPKETVRFNLMVPSELMERIDQICEKLPLSKAQVMLLGTIGIVQKLEQSPEEFLAELVHHELIVEKSRITYEDALRKLKESQNPDAADMHSSLLKWRSKPSASSKDKNTPGLQGWDSAVKYGDLYKKYPDMKDIIFGSD